MVKPWALLDNQPFVLNHLLQYNNKQYPIQDQKSKRFIALSLLTSISSALAPEGVILMLGKPSKKKSLTFVKPPLRNFF